MFVSHEHSNFNYIELYTLLQQTLPSQQSQIIDQFEPVDSDEAEDVDLDEAEGVDENEAEVDVDVVDDEKEESEIQVDNLLNTNTEYDDNQAPLSPSHVYSPPPLNI